MLFLSEHRAVGPASALRGAAHRTGTLPEWLCEEGAALLPSWSAVIPLPPVILCAADHLPPTLALRNKVLARFLGAGVGSRVVREGGTGSGRVGLGQHRWDEDEPCDGPKDYGMPSWTGMGIGLGCFWRDS